MTPQEEMIQGIQEHGKQKRGMTNLIRYLQGKELTQQQAIHAHCYHCNGYGEFEDCEVDTCPLYPFAPYSSKRRLARKRKESVTTPSTSHSLYNRVSGVR